MAGPQNLPGDLSRFQRVDTAERIDRLIRRLEAFPHYLAEHRANLLEGIAAGRTAAAPVVARVIEQTRRAVEAPVDQSPLADRPSRSSTTSHANASARRSRSTSRRRWPTISPRSRAMPSTRGSGEGIWALPDGRELYETMILASTTLEETPEAIHQYGLDQLEADPRGNGRHRARAGLRRRRLDAPRARVGEVELRRRQRRDRRSRDAPDREGKRGSARALRPPAHGTVRGARGRAVPGGRGATGVLLPARAGRLARRHLLRQHIPARESAALSARRDDLSRGDAGPSLPDRDRERARPTCPTSGASARD